VNRIEQRAWYQYDWASAAFPTPILTVFLAVYLTGVAEPPPVRPASDASTPRWSTAT
jgi:MFS-type transporter involved in bile tolerance (Atg22 family)